MLVHELQDEVVGSTLGECGLSLADRFMARRAQVRRLFSRETLFVEGDPVESLFLIRSGTIRCCLFAEDGRRLITRFATAGDFLGLASGDRFTYTAEAIDTACVATCPKPVFESQLGRDPMLCHELRDLFTQELAASRELMMTHMRMVAAERVMWFLCHFARRADKDENGYSALPMTRLDIADHLGLTIETVSRTVTALKAEGWIDMPDTKHFRLTERAHESDLCAAA